ncbi:Metalloenzyme, LuxS/M16 peptidase-like protein [Fimicolochytrium jonesii]|uniref:Metalloenzyme, LuxS/M16 peptidase-like protein n=1 Tax=Fimicolochytrium jonesii TaxID=1396493 RepID=UPI0022FE948F|nr:Metalloenzyme, LuxS/M16 peptidase-like protein [Fimicolochytrium jonesii]KAI8825830.1 Metalloenzyme, LuxS/M16 peptidase-like protein [Fimicolochytrium jonesii]
MATQSVLQPPPGSVFEDIIKPDQDDRSYRLLTLDNKLQALLISDPNTDKSSAALDVHVGHLCDPDDVAGLAHFCEHLLFMGTEKYPVENDYNQYLSEHGGHSNAFTSVENTNYYFEVTSEHFEGALDRFAQFFITPLFAESCTEREMNAVDSEHKKNLQSDNWRLYQLEKDLSSPGHPFRKFGTGNLETLRDIPLQKGLDIRKILLDFHSKYYSANIMKLVILGKEPLDTLAAWTTSRFAEVKNKDIAVPSFTGHPLTPVELGKEILIKPVKELRHLELTFPFPDTRTYYRSQPSKYLAHLIGHEGDGSILSLLKSKGWAIALSAGVSHGGINFDFFKVSVDLTLAGVEHYEEIVPIIFQYIDMVKKDGVQDWIFQECKQLATMSFRFKEKSPPSSYTSRLAGHMHEYLPADVLAGPYLLYDYDPDKIKMCLDYLRRDNFRLTLVSPAQDTKEPLTFEKAQWYGTEYAVRDLPENLQKALANSGVNNPELRLPARNEFIPEKFDVRKSEREPLPHAEIIKDTSLTRMWHKKDDVFLVPKANVWFQLKSPMSYVTPLACTLTRVYTDLLKDALNEFSYYAEVAGLSYALENNTDGMVLILGGYNDKLPILLTKIVEKMKSLKVDPLRFKFICEQVCRSYKNWAMESPHQHAMYYISHLTQEKLWTHEEKLTELYGIKAEHIEEFYPHLLKHMYVEGLAHGNIEAETALKLVSILEDAFQPKPLPHFQRSQTLRTQLLPTGISYVHTREVPNADNLNSAIEYYIQVGDFTDTTLRAHLSLFSQIAHEPAFDQLRTKEQLGYMVFSGLRKSTGAMGFRVIIQSEKDPAFLETRINAWLDSMRQTLLDMTPEEFKKHQNALAARLLEKDKNLAQESHRLWTHVSSRYYNFEQHVEDAARIHEVQQAELVNFYEEHIAVGSAFRRKLSVHVRSQKAATTEDLDEAVQNAIKDVTGAPNTVVINGEEMAADIKATWELSKGAFPNKPVEEYKVKELQAKTKL